MLKLKITQEVKDGLLFLGNEISIEISKKLIVNTIKNAIVSEAIIPSPEVNASKFAKQAKFAVLSLFYLAIKYDYNSDKLRDFLEENSIHTAIVEELIEVYDKNRPELSSQSFQIGHSFPHITDIEWKAMCDVKSSNSNSSSGELSFHIDLGTYEDNSGERVTIVDFVCNTEELQSFLNKLKEIERHCEKIGNIGLAESN